jgi:hypothetical protein
MQGNLFFFLLESQCNIVSNMNVDTSKMILYVSFIVRKSKDQNLLLFVGVKSFLLYFIVPEEFDKNNIW